MTTTSSTSTTATVTTGTANNNKNNNNNKKTLAQDYKAAVDRPAEKVFDYRGEHCHRHHDITTTMDLVILREHEDDDDNNNNNNEKQRQGQAIAWVIPNVLSSVECDDVIEKAEAFGLHAPQKATMRDAKRTSQYVNQELSDMVFPRIESSMHEHLMENEIIKAGPLYGIHPNWRIVQYHAVGTAFPAHQDQMDSFQIKHEDGRKDLVVSSHTLLINISRNAEKVNGGATRFYPKTIKTKKNGVVTPTASCSGPYDYAVDVYLPRGWALVFRQQGLIHAGQPILDSCCIEGQHNAEEDVDNDDGNVPAPYYAKYVAQAGILRMLPPDQRVRPSIFRLGPGLQEELDEMAKNFDHTALLQQHVFE